MSKFGLTSVTSDLPIGILAPEPVDAEAGLPFLDYKERMVNWEQTSGLRSPWRMPDFAAESGKLPWSPDQVPLAEHVAVKARWDKVGWHLLQLNLERFNRFTFDLELCAVTPVAARMATGNLPIALPAALRRDALRIATDECWHAACARGLRAGTQGAWGPPPAAIGPPQFLRVLRAEIDKQPNARLKALAEFTFVIVSETLITGALSGVPKDARVHPAVRAVLSEHHREEAYHHAVFAGTIDVVWSQLDAADKDVVGPMFATFCRAFLDPNSEAEVQWLVTLGYDERAARDIVMECDWRLAVQRAESASPTIRHLRRHGVLDTASAADALAMHQLI